MHTGNSAALVVNANRSVHTLWKSLLSWFLESIARGAKDDLFASTSLLAIAIEVQQIKRIIFIFIEFFVKAKGRHSSRSKEPQFEGL